MPRVALWLTLTVLAQTTVSAGGTYQSLASITDTVATYLDYRSASLERPPRIEVGRIDPRLKLPLCDAPLEAYSPPGSREVGNVTIGVRCSGSQPWNLYVSAKVLLIRPVLVLAQAVARNETLSTHHLRIEEKDVSRLTRGFFEDPRDVLGMQVRMPLLAGRVLDASALTLPTIVQRGQTVTLLAGSEGFQVRTTGRALQDGAAGDVIAVKNLRSDRVVEGVVSGAGLVQVSM